MAALCLLLASCSKQPGQHAMHDPFQALSIEEYDITPRAEATFSYLLHLEYKEKDPERALQHLQNALKADPNPGLYLELAQLHLDSDELQQARHILLQATDKFPYNPRLAMALSRLYSNQDRPEEALNVLQSFLQTNPEEVSVLQRLAELHLEQDQPAKALQALQKIPEEKQGEDIHLLLAQSYLEQQKRQEGIDHLERAVDIEPRSARAWAELAYQYELQGEYIQARDSYQRLLELGIDSQQIYARLIDINLKLNNPDEALNKVEEGPDHEQFLFQVCNLFLQQEFYDQAEHILEKIAEKGYTSPEQYLLQAILAFHSYEDLDLALEKLEQIPEDSEHFERSLDLQTRLLYREERQEQALEKARQGRNMFQDNQEFWILESEILVQEDRLQEARDLAVQALEKFPEDEDILFQKGFIKYEMDLKDKALEIMEQVIAMDPEHDPALNFVGYTLAEEGRDLQRALNLIQKALELDPDNGYYLDSLAWVYYKSGDLEQAWKFIQKAVEQVQDDAVIWEHYGDIAKDLSHEEEAQKGYQKSLALDPDDEQEIKDKLQSL